MPLEQTLQLINLLAFALFANIPLGYQRQGTRKYSVAWFVYIHLSIPFIILLRHILGFGWGYVPFTLGCAVAGQLIGGRLHRRRHR